jgi:hypothetical protein
MTFAGGLTTSGRRLMTSGGEETTIGGAPAGFGR